MIFTNLTIGQKWCIVQLTIYNDYEIDAVYIDSDINLDDIFK